MTANIVLDVQAGIAANAPVLSSVSGSATGTVTATLSNFTAQLRVGDVVAFSKQWCFS